MACLGVGGSKATHIGHENNPGRIATEDFSWNAARPRASRNANLSGNLHVFKA